MPSIDILYILKFMKIDLYRVARAFAEYMYSTPFRASKSVINQNVSSSKRTYLLYIYVYILYLSNCHGKIT